MATRFMQFPDEETAHAALDGFDGTLDDIGHVYRYVPDASSDDGLRAEQIPGYHVNAVGDIPEAAKPFEVFPKTPMRVFL